MSERWQALTEPPGDGAAPDALLFAVQGARVLVGSGGEIPGTFETDAHPIFLGLLDGQECWGVSLGRADEPPPGCSLQDLRMLHPSLGERRWAIAGRAVQLVEWAATSRYCGRCGTPTAPSDLRGERAMKCPSCGLLAFPRLAPAIITLVTRDDGRALLGQGVSFGVPMYSCLAGFVEPGETLEEAVEREVREEVGVVVRDVRYRYSQPWPFPHSLMLGFRAAWESGEIEIDPAEIVDAAWFAPDDLPMIPPGVSIARRLIDEWVTQP